MTDDSNIPPKKRLFWIEKMSGINDALNEPQALSRWARYSLIMVVSIAITAIGLSTFNQLTKQDSAAFSGTLAETAEAEDSKSIIEVEDIIGSAEFFGEKQTWLPLRITSALSVGNRVRTAGDSYVTLRLLGQHIIRLDANSEIKLLAIKADAEEAEKGEINLFQKSGQVYHRTSVTGVSYRISTPQLNVGFDQGAAVTALSNTETRSTVRMVSGEGLVEWTDQSLRLSEGDETSVDDNQTELVAARTPLDFFKTAWMEVNRQADLRLGLPLGRMADLTPPTLQIVAPKANEVVEEAVISLIGQSEPGATISVNTQTAEVDANGLFQLSLELTLGSNTLQIIALDRAGNQNIVSLGVTYQPTEPESVTNETPVTSTQSDDQSTPISTSLVSPSTAPALVTMDSLSAELRPNGSVSVSWTSSDPTVVRYGLAWSKKNETPSRCSSDPDVSSEAVSANGYSLTGLPSGTWFIGVNPEISGGEPCAGLKIITIEVAE